MLRTFLATAMLVGMALVPPGARAAAPFVFKSVHHELPDSDKMFSAGPGSDQINNNCLACHSADMVLNQPALSRDAWEAEVEKMINAYKAPVAAQDVSAIVDYLTSLKGK